MPEPVTGPYEPLNKIATPDTVDNRGGALTGDATPPLAGGDDTPVAGSQRGRFTILKEHAKGGLGKVSLARDDKLRRQVALKEIRPEHGDDPYLRQRFLTEAEITGMLEHPGIVPIYQMDEDARGRPFYAMRFIQGRTLGEAIREFHDQSDAGTRRRGDAAKDSEAAIPASPRPRVSASFDSLAFRDLLKRFIDVCNTIAYAHSKGVIHRDLKPANIMLGDYGETLVVDWGLAKRVRVAEAERSDAPEGPDRGFEDSAPATQELHTAAGTVLGTAPYMSPEQAAGNTEHLGPATDIYALGAMLYELLTGRPPYRGKSGAEVLAQVKAGSPPAPSRLLGRVPEPLEAVCLKALARQARERYGDAAELARDVDRWLADEPVSAYSEPWSVRTGRWMRRHRLLVTGVAALLLATVPLSVVIAVNREQARRQAEADKLEIGRQKDIAEANEKTANENDAIQQAVLDFVEKKVFAAARPKDQAGGLGYDVRLADAVKAALPFVEESFTNQPLIEARLRLTLGASFSDLGEAKIAAEQEEIARALYTKHRGADHPRTIQSMSNLANSYSNLGRHTHALKLREETLALVKARYGSDHPDWLRDQSNLAITYAALGRDTDALKLRDEVLTLMRAKLGPHHADTLLGMANLANSYSDLGRHAEALKLREEALTLMEAKLGPHHPDTLAAMMGVANSYYALGRRADALKLDEETLALMKTKLGPNHPGTLEGMNNLAGSYYALGRHADALWLWEETVALRKAKLGPDHPDTLRSMSNLAVSYQALGRHGDALKLREDTLAFQKTQLGPNHPHTLSSMLNLANSYAALDRHADALKLFEQTLALTKAKLGPDHPHTLASMNDLAASYTAHKRHAEAFELFEQTLALRKAKLGPDHPDTLVSMGNLIFNLVKLGRGAEAVPIIDECVQRASRQFVIPQLIPDMMDVRLRHFEKAKDAAGCRATAEMWEKLKRTDARSLHDAACMRAVTAAQLGDKPDEAKAEADRAMAWLHQAVLKGYKDAAHMKKDADLAPLRQREDFRKLLAELEAKGK